MDILTRANLQLGDRLYEDDSIWVVTETGLSGVAGGAVDWDWEGIEANGGISGTVQKVEVLRAVCACGYTATDPVTLELWNGYGQHADADDTPAHQVSVWTLADGSVAIADNRDRPHPNDHAPWSR